MVTSASTINIYKGDKIQFSTYQRDYRRNPFGVRRLSAYLNIIITVILLESKETVKLSSYDRLMGNILCSIEAAFLSVDQR